ncbi:TIGD4 [Cordylochernes scorpioides]|uniref:TIGD4 n=1 Tax=Cordylochernes scorpioides TaxID=51811 RepID=A0ABY6K6A8_9ARAC|nr:TIGD4 [Cordylochernes scorpioides]
MDCESSFPQSGQVEVLAGITQLKTKMPADPFPSCARGHTQSLHPLLTSTQQPYCRIISSQKRKRESITIDILTQAEKWENYTVGTSKRQRVGKFSDLEDALFNWFTQKRANNNIITDDLLKEKAKKLGEQLDEPENFTYSSGWLRRFKGRFHISQRRGEGASISPAIIDEHLTNLNSMLANSGCDPANIYNADETGLFFQLIPDRTLAHKDVNCRVASSKVSSLNIASFNSRKWWNWRMPIYPQNYVWITLCAFVKWLGILLGNCWNHTGIRLTSTAAVEPLNYGNMLDRIRDIFAITPENLITEREFQLVDDSQEAEMKLTDDNFLVSTVTAKEKLGEDDDTTVIQRLPLLREARRAAETVFLFLEHSKRATSDDDNLSADLLRRVCAISEGDKRQVVITDFFKKISGNTPSLARAESPSKAEEKPARLGSKAQPSAELPARNALKFNSTMKSTKNQRYANPATGGKDANPAAPTDFAAASSSEAAAQAHRNWAELSEDSNSEYEGNFTIVQKRKRRRGSANSSPAAAPSSNLGGARTNRRPQSSAGWAPRAQEVRTTRAHIVEARARQASSTEDHCVYVERSPELEPYHYMRAMDRMFGSTREVFQVTKMNGHFLVGLANRGMAERLVNEGLEVEGTLHRVFPFRKRAERITVGNLPFFVGDAAVISALTPLGRVTSIAPKLMKAGPYTYNDGRREAFIILREGMTIEGLPTRLNITIKGEAWPAYLSSGIRCSRCRGQGHRRANCPLLAGRTNAPGPATPTSPTSVPSASAPGLPQQPSAQPPPPASPSPAMEVSEVPSTSRAALPPAAPRQSPPVAPAIPTEMAPPAPPPVAPAPSLRAPGSHGPAVPTLDVEMSIEETSTSRAALKTSPAAVPPTPPLPAPQPAGPIPPAPDEEEMTPIMREECMVIEILKKLKHLTCLRPLYQSGIQPNDLKAVTLHTQDRGHCDCCDRDVWRHLMLFIGHDNRNLTWTQSSSFTDPR